MYMKHEGVFSSQIEGIQSTLEDVLEYEVGIQSTLEDVLEYEVNSREDSPRG